MIILFMKQVEEMLETISTYILTPQSLLVFCLHF